MTPRNEKARFDLAPMYLNQRRLAGLVGDQALLAALRMVTPGLSGKMLGIAEASVCKGLVLRYLRETEPPPPAFELSLATGALRVGMLFTAFREFTCRNVRCGSRRGPDRAPVAHTTYEGLTASIEKLKLTLLLHHDHVMPGSPGDLLSGRVPDLFVLAAVHELLPGEVRAVPIVIGHKFPGPDHFLTGISHDICELPPEAIDSFSLMRDEPHPKKNDLELLKTVPEEQVKHAFATILEEPNIPLDWGGEQSDLFSTNVKLDAVRVPTAFVFKGPAKFRPMTMAELGKNGDQLIRLAQEPADLLVVQHCHEITKPVRAVLRAICNQVGSSRRCSVIDGYDTLRILRAYEHCGFRRSRPRKRR